MGDLIGERVNATLWWVPQAELTRIREAGGQRHLRAKCFADACRLNALYMIAKAGSGHIGSSFSSMDIVCHLHLDVLRRRPDGSFIDTYFSSKGHDAPGLYAVLIGLGLLPERHLHELRRLHGLPGHPDVGTPGIATNTGSLGMGISKAKGMALARRLKGDKTKIYVMTGDGELQEGQVWESLFGAVNFGLSEVTVIVDHNKLQSDTFIESTSSLGDLEAKFRSFGLDVRRVDGHDFEQLEQSSIWAAEASGTPKVLIADTVKGKGVTFMEHTSLDSDTALYRFHSGAPDADTYSAAVRELIESIRQATEVLGIFPLEFCSTERPRVASVPVGHSLIPAYRDALVQVVRDDSKVVMLDADLCVDTGQSPARTLFPSRHFECGIAEMDMVSMAGGLALEGQVPLCHSFACFLTTRANEQIYNNATEHTKVVYVASLAGLIPAGPGHSHQSVRDISALGGVPNLMLVAPGSPAEVHPLLSFAVNDATGSTMLRLESQATPCRYELPEGYVPVPGKGVEVRPGEDVAFIGYGPLLLNEAIEARRLLQETHGVRVAVINLPWLNRIDARWLKKTVGHYTHLFTLDNHYVRGGQGELIAATLATTSGTPPNIHHCGLTEIPQSGQTQEVLEYHQLDARSLVRRVVDVLLPR